MPLQDDNVSIQIGRELESVTYWGHGEIVGAVEDSTISETVEKQDEGVKSLFTRTRDPYMS